MSQVVSIAGREVGPGRPCFVIAEAGVNHNGDMSMARDLVKAAAEAGADAVKFQTFSADRLATRTAPKADYQRRTTSSAESQYEMLKKLELSREAHEDLMKLSREMGIVFLSSAFDELSIDLLDELDVAAFKVPSGELVNTPYLKHLASKGRPVILSSGMSSIEEVVPAMDILRGVLVILLHCVSLYPAPAGLSNLRAMDTLRERFDVPVGYSDHSEGITVALAAVARGAQALEKHFTLDRKLPGPDHAASLEPEELAEMVRQVRVVESALGDGRKVPADAEASTAAIARKSVVAATEIPAGSVLTREMLALKRPGDGLPPSQLESLVGRKAAVAIPADTVIRMDMLT